MYPVIIQTQLVLNRRADAKDSLRAWIKVDPVDPAPVAQLLGLLIEDSTPAVAIREGEAALPTCPRMKQRVCPDFSGAGLPDGWRQAEGLGVAGGLADTQDAGILNDAAYILFDASLELCWPSRPRAPR